MTGEAIFWPVLLQAALTYAIYILASSRRLGAIRNGQAKASDFRIPNVEPEPSATVIRNLINQFELPVLFYVCCIILFILGAVSTLAVILAWIFALSRIAHAAVHVTSNRLRFRRPLFIVVSLHRRPCGWFWRSGCCPVCDTGTANASKYEKRLIEILLARRGDSAAFSWRETS